MKFRNTLFLSLIAMLTIFSSCKKEEKPVDSCTNGFLDPGEDGIDCGGTCDPCATYNPPYLGLEVNETPVTMTSKTLAFDGSNWILSMFNDSLNFTFNLGPTGNVSSGPISPTSTSATFYSTPYPNQSNGAYAISQHDLNQQTMSGFFDIDFSRTGFIDTIHVTNGTFEYLIY